MFALPPVQIVAAEPALAVGIAFTVTTTEFELVHPFNPGKVSVTVYVVVIVGLTFALEFVELNPAGLLLQE
jgi:hypothetical protein